MAKIADADKMRAGKLDSAWVKAVWVGRVDRSNEHLLLTTKVCIKSRVVRRIPDGNQASYHAEVQGLPWDTLKGSAEMYVLRMDQEESVSSEEQARRRLRSKQPARRSLTDDEAVTKRLKREATIAAIKQEILNTDTERPEMNRCTSFMLTSGQ